VDGNLKSLLALVAQARKIKKAVYLFSTDPDGSKVTHVNYVPEHQVKNGFDAKVWANAVTGVLGGKVGHSLYRYRYQPTPPYTR
jgi:alanyl-tRNA synthetase